MMRSLFSGVSGLKSHQTKMDVIGNNIANINTVGFKSSRATFADMLSQTQAGAAAPTSTQGGTNPKQIGLGVAVASIDLIFTDGSPQSTGKNTDLALSGNGLFVVKNGDSIYYTRDGAFEFDGNGNYVLPGSGYLVQGWNAVEGALNTNSTPTNIVVPAGKTMPAASTTQVDFSGNLNASSATISGITYTSGGATSHPEDVVTSADVTGISVYTETKDKFVTLSESNVNSVALVFEDGTSASVSYGTAADTSSSHVYTVGGTYTSSDGTTTKTIKSLTYTAQTVSVSTAINTAESTATAINNDYVNLTVHNESTGENTTQSVKSGAYEVGDEYQIIGVNIDGTNVIAATLTLSDNSTQKITNGYYQLNHSTPLTTIITIYDSEGKAHEVTLLLDKDLDSVDEDANTDAVNLANVRDAAGNALDFTSLVRGQKVDGTGNYQYTLTATNGTVYEFIPNQDGKFTAEGLDGEYTINWPNRWRVYIAPDDGKEGPATEYSKTELDGSHTNGVLNGETYSELTTTYTVEGMSSITDSELIAALQQAGYTVDPVTHKINSKSQEVEAGTISPEPSSETIDVPKTYSVTGNNTDGYTVTDANGNTIHDLASVDGLVADATSAGYSTTTQTVIASVPSDFTSPATIEAGGVTYTITANADGTYTVTDAATPPVEVTNITDPLLTALTDAGYTTHADTIIDGFTLPGSVTTGTGTTATTYNITGPDGDGNYTVTPDGGGTALTADEVLANTALVTELEDKGYHVDDAGVVSQASTIPTIDGTAHYTLNSVGAVAEQIRGGVSYIYFNEDGSLSSSATSGSSITLTYSDGNGAAATTSAITFDGLTQYSGNSTAYPSADGNVAGVLQSVSVDTSGIITGTYTNGKRRFEAQVAIAQFTNASGLTKVGTSLYQASNNSGVANIKTAPDLGLTITPSALEMSNVDLANEFAEMITTQRGFQSNSKVITVGDEMLETLVNMKR